MARANQQLFGIPTNGRQHTPSALPRAWCPKRISGCALSSELLSLPELLQQQLKPWGSAPNPAFAMWQPPGMKNKTHPRQQPIAYLASRMSRGFRGINVRGEKAPLSHLFHGPLDILPASILRPFPFAQKTIQRSIQGVGGEGDSLLERAKSLRTHQTDAELRLWYYLRAHRFMGMKFKRQKTYWMLYS